MDSIYSNETYVGRQNEMVQIVINCFNCSLQIFTWRNAYNWEYGTYVQEKVQSTSF